MGPKDSTPSAIPAYLSVVAEQLASGHSVKLTTLTDANSVAQHMAESLFQEIAEAQKLGRNATLIVPVGPVDQFPILARLINERRLPCRETMIINMDEYLSEDRQWIPLDHPLSFRAFMDRHFYNLLDPALAPAVSLRVFPHPDHPERIAELIKSRGGVDACFGGIGINGHIAFNEPPTDSMTIEEFADLPTRTLPLACETRTINSVTVGGEISVVPKRAVTVGMREILASRKLRFYCNRSWQSAVVRRVLHGPVTSACPASLLRTHPDAAIVVADYVAALPVIQLR